ncbi:DUF3846 domain-containing protein [Ammoniphilus resinae]|uniref:DUF3846 domain-containing protein n=1 Tax=Ammoniphilus resinae TaxID=861532 RepID=A0ABS4GMY0_9BACL|nr:hypothetical protein [Ammoniphilus resinae]MBP1931638.1 hypothetical protein [Ammoniphilus resinae]
MFTIIHKIPDQVPKILQIENLEAIEALIEDEFEAAYDDHLEGIVFFISEAARGIKANNFTMKTEGFYDWVYGPCVIAKLQEDSIGSLNKDEIQLVMDYFTSRKG